MKFFLSIPPAMPWCRKMKERKASLLRKRRLLKVIYKFPVSDPVWLQLWNKRIYDGALGTSSHMEALKPAEGEMVFILGPWYCSWPNLSWGHGGSKWHGSGGPFSWSFCWPFGGAALYSFKAYMLGCMPRLMAFYLRMQNSMMIFWRLRC